MELLTVIVIIYALGLRKLYVKVLSHIFDYVNDSIAEIQKKRRERSISDSDESDIVQVNKAEETVEKVPHTDLCFESITTVMNAIVEDQVTPRFEEEKLEFWNLMRRQSRNYEYLSWKITALWMTGFIFRHFILFPVRVFILFFGMIMLILSTAIVGQFKEGPFKRFLNRYVSKACFNVLTQTFSTVITFNNPRNRPKAGICVANHTSPLDVVLLMCDNLYSSIGQKHAGFAGIIQRALSRASPHIWFERSKANDRHEVITRMRNHIADPNNPPILIFPEGTCINNTSVMQFKKGSFELGSVIYPVTIKYDPRFGNAFWNSTVHSMVYYIYQMMTSWSIVCEVWYLPPMYQNEGESPIEFANRVKSVIAKQGELVDLEWDGQLKRSKPKKELLQEMQREYSRRLLVD